MEDRVEANGPRRRERWAVVLAVAAYLAGFLFHPPRTFSIGDEAMYVGQALCFARGESTEEFTDAITGQKTRALASTYPPGTSLLQTPFVVVGGWRWAALASALSLAVATLLTARWLERDGLSPLGALLVLGYAPALVMGRVAMSDAPSCAAVVATLVLLRASERRAAWALAAGVVAGFALLLRETNGLVLAPWFAGALARRRALVALAIGGAAGIALRAAVALALFGSVAFIRDPGWGFSPRAAVENGPLYLFASLVLVPGGLAAAAFTRSQHRIELACSVGALFLLYLFYEYSGASSGGLRRLVLGPRYLMPVVPLLAVAVTERATALVARLRGLERLARLAVAAWVLAVAVAAFAVHPIFDAQTDEQVATTLRIYELTAESRPVVLNFMLGSKLIHPAFGPRTVVERAAVRSEGLPALLARWGAADIVFVDRSDTESFRDHGRENDRFLADFSKVAKLEPVVDETGPRLRLRILRARPR